MNFKKIKKSLVSIVLGSSLFLVNGGVICQQPKAWLTDEFFKTAEEKHKKSPEMIKIIKVLKLFSDLHNEPKYAATLSTIYQSNLSYRRELPKAIAAEMAALEEYYVDTLSTILYRTELAKATEAEMVEKVEKAEMDEMVEKAAEALVLAEFEQLCKKWFTLAMEAATNSESTASVKLPMKKGGNLKVESKTILYGVRGYAEKSGKTVTAILKPELIQILSASQIKNPPLGDQLKKLQNSAIELLS